MLCCTICQCDCLIPSHENIYCFDILLAITIAIVACVVCYVIAALRVGRMCQLEPSKIVKKVVVLHEHTSSTMLVDRDCLLAVMLLRPDQAIDF